MIDQGGGEDQISLIGGFPKKKDFRNGGYW